MDTLAFTSGFACLLLITTLLAVIHYQSERRRRRNLSRLNLSRLRQYDRAAWKRHRLS